MNSAISLSLSGSDPDGDDINFVANPVFNTEGTEIIMNVALSNNGGSLILTPVPDWFGVATVPVSVYDETGLYSSTTFTVTVENVNDAPEFDNFAEDLSINEDVASTVTLNASDIDDTELSYSAIATPEGSLELSVEGNQLTILPANNFIGDASVSVTVSDVGGLTDTYSFSVNIIPLVDAPIIVAINDTTVFEDSVVTIPLFNNDADGDFSHYLVGVVNNVSSVVNIDGDNYTLQVTPDPNWNGSVEITVQSFDESGGSDTESFTLTVLSIDDKPFVENEIEPIYLVEDFDYTWNLNLNTIFTDLDHDLSYRAYLEDPTVADVSIVDNMMYINSIPDGTGETDMIVTATSPLPSDENYALEFEAMSDYAVSYDVSNQIFGDERSFTVEVWYKNPGVDVGGNADVDAFTSIVTNYREFNNGNIYNNFNLRMDSYQNTGIVDFLGTYSNERLDDNYWHHIVAMYNDETGLVSLYVDGVLNDINELEDDFVSTSNNIYVNQYAPFAGEYQAEMSIAGLKISKGAVFTNNFTPLFPLVSDENSLVCIDFTSEVEELVDLSGNNHSFLIGGSPSWDQGQGAFVTDVSDTVRVVVQPSNDDPVMVQLADQTINEDSQLKIALYGTDEDGDDIYFTVSPVANLQTSISSGGDSLIVNPDLNWNGTAEVMVSLFDTPGGSDNSTFTLTVNPIDDPPTQIGNISNISFSEDFDIPWSVDLSTIFEDVDNELSYSASLIDNTIANVEIDNSIVNLASILNANGETEMVVTASGDPVEQQILENEEDNYSLSFDGESNYVELPDNGLFSNTNAFTINADIYIDGNFLSSETIFAKGYSTESDINPKSLLVHLENDGSLSFILYDSGSNWIRKNVPWVFDENDFNNITLVYNGGTNGNDLEVYINGSNMLGDVTNFGSLRI